MEEREKGLVDELHLRKIDLADSIYVINKGGYWGESTRREIELQKPTGEEVLFMEESATDSSHVA